MLNLNLFKVARCVFVFFYYLLLGRRQIEFL